MNKRINPVLDAKQHVCARRDKNNLESRFINTIKGYGVFATARIEEGSFLVEYRGVLRDPGQCVPDAYSYYFIYNHTRYCIDASVDDGSLGRLVNDDSNPNAKAKVISINRIPHLCLFALRDIQPGEEITYDYGGYDLPWRRGTWLSMENNSQFDSNHRKETEGQQEQETSIKGTTASQTNVECEEVPMRTDKTTQTTEQNASVDDMMWNYIPYQCLTTDDQRICENQLLLIQKTPVTQQILFEEGKRTNEDPATSRQILELQQTSMDVEPCVKEQSGPVSAAQMTNEVREMECNEDANPVSCHEPCVEEQSCPVSATQTLEQQQAHMQQVDQCKEDQESSPLSAAQSTCEEKQLTGQDEQCRIQAGEETEQQLCNNDSSRTQNATQSEADLDSRRDSSNDETESSDEDFIPNSESDDDSDGERPKKKSKATDTSKDTEEQAMPPVPNPSVIQATKLNFCFVCGKASTKISRHLKLHRKDNIEIATAFELPKRSKQRLNLLEVLRNRGNYQHNNSVLIQGSGLIKARRKPKDGIDAQKFENCMYCKGLYMRKVLWKHVKRCPSNLERDTLKSSRFVLGLAALSKCPHLKNMSEDVKKMVCDMHQDEVAQVVRNDEYLLKLAQDFFDKKGSSKERHSFVRQTVRCIGKFLVLLQNKFAIRNLAEAVKPSSFTLVIEAIKEIAEFNEETKCYAIPSLARRIGLALRKYCILSAQKAFAVGDNILIQATSTFMDLFNNANFALGEKRGLNIQSKSLLLPFVNDVRIFYCYLEKALQSALRELRETPSAQSYAALCKVTLAQILMFNRRYGEVSQMTIKSFQKRDLVQPLEISELLTELEKVFCKEERKILVRWKAGAQVPTILTSDMINAIMLLTEKREQCNVSKSNIFVFGQTRSNRFYRGETALRICAHECGATYPENLISTEFSAHISTLTQILTLKNHELKKLAKFIGHDISLRKEYYRQSEAIPRLAKICKLVFAIEKGSASEMIKQSLDDIELPEEIRESDSEDEYFEDDNTFLEDRAARRKLALENLAKYKAPKINCFASSPKRKKQVKESTAKENKSTFKEDDIQPTTEDPEETCSGAATQDGQEKSAVDQRREACNHEAFQKTHLLRKTGNGK
ncbi:uncharacterized protein LOC132852213 [Tachysurus vachellii]|uniref:uncharacterized protein LOC132852213 n=1 Tax=Tachysurus vachellii TaxID=175792 RepID=UPI00296AEAB9|nr:uncharacterized protein LOC132852213 [Tachysurus vachellii]